MKNKDTNALRYAAGYICRSLRKNIESSSHPLMEELVLCLMDLIDDDEEDTASSSSDWLNTIDRGGLWHVSENTYMTFVAMEEELCRHLNKTSALNITVGLKKEVIQHIHVAVNEDVLFYWSMNQLKAMVKRGRFS